MVNLTLTQLINHDKKILAIKNLRSVSGLGLKESKDAVDALADRGTPFNFVGRLDKVNELTESFDYKIGNVVGDDPNALALRAAVLGISDETLTALVATLAPDSPTRVLFTEAAVKISFAKNSPTW